VTTDNDPTPAGQTDGELVVEDVSVRFPIQRFPIRRELPALREVSLRVRRGQVLSVVGESGCGKTTLTRVLAGLQRPTSGQVSLAGQQLWSMPPRLRRKLIARTIGLVFQDPTSSMNLGMPVRQIIEDPLRVHRWGDRASRQRRVVELLDTVRLPRGVLDRRPSEISGGQRQRVAIARALALEPAFLLADEPTSALDVSLRTRLLDLLAGLRESQGLGVLLVSHDLQAVRYLSDTVAVMYLGQVVECGRADDLVDRPAHPYSAALLSAAPTLTRARRERIVLNGGPPSPLEQPAGCPFHPRCWRADDDCRRTAPPDSLAANAHRFRCFHPLVPSPAT
jgi:peptide/nickel transport system ATP-binding protein